MRYHLLLRNDLVPIDPDSPLPGCVVVIMNSDPSGSASLRVTDGPFNSKRGKAPTTLYTTYIYILILQHSFF